MHRYIGDEALGVTRSYARRPDQIHDASHATPCWSATGKSSNCHRVPHRHKLVIGYNGWAIKDRFMDLILLLLKILVGGGSGGGGH